MPRDKLQNEEPAAIVNRYNVEIRGLYNYYCIADNVSTLNEYCSVMKYSMLKTLSSKYRCSMKEIKARYAR